MPCGRNTSLLKVSGQLRCFHWKYLGGIIRDVFVRISVIWFCLSLLVPGFKICQPSGYHSRLILFLGFILKCSMMGRECLQIIVHLFGKFSNVKMNCKNVWSSSFRRAGNKHCLSRLKQNISHLCYNICLRGRNNWVQWGLAVL